MHKMMSVALILNGPGCPAGVRGRQLGNERRTSPAGGTRGLSGDKRAARVKAERQLSEERDRRERKADKVHTVKFRVERSSEMRDNGDDDQQASTVEDIEAERHELAELIGKLLAWDWLERRREKEQPRSAASEGQRLRIERDG